MLNYNVSNTQINKYKHLPKANKRNITNNRLYKNIK